MPSAWLGVILGGERSWRERGMSIVKAFRYPVSVGWRSGRMARASAAGPRPPDSTRVSRRRRGRLELARGHRPGAWRGTPAPKPKSAASSRSRSTCRSTSGSYFPRRRGSASASNPARARPLSAADPSRARPGGPPRTRASRRGRVAQRSGAGAQVLPRRGIPAFHPDRRRIGALHGGAPARPQTHLRGRLARGSCGR
jgi:hypothetical protein